MNPEEREPLPEKASTIRAIRLRPCSTDYPTAVKTTADAMGLTGPAASKSKPIERVLWLTNSDQAGFLTKKLPD
ncbi:hypothetical protein [Haloferula sp. BvORR071]|uniref:hypothetical protein n=1 Tax=Haloferula sp. BvORR071 TaxID=1396141 RepID=UPI0005545B73|nr:hypothetical protein [Haloferula sp. BvORR071]